MFTKSLAVLSITGIVVLGAATSAFASSTYTVKHGQTLSGIGKEVGQSYQQLAAENGISNPNLIYPGEVLHLSGSGPVVSPVQPLLTPSAPSGSPQEIAAELVPSGSLGCFDDVISRESGWDVTAVNPSSGAYGLGQALPGSKMASAGSDWQTN